MPETAKELLGAYWEGDVLEINQQGIIRELII
jgi:hypothetical protein